MHLKFPENVVYDVKRFMGKRFSEISEDAENVTYKVEEDAHGFPVIIVNDQKFKLGTNFKHDFN